MTEADYRNWPALPASRRRSGTVRAPFRGARQARAKQRAVGLGGIQPLRK